jgi:cysteinyl-tRNA synthetase
VAAEKGLKRLWDGYDVLRKLQATSDKQQENNAELEAKILKLIAELNDFMNDDFSTAKVLANLFEIVPVINGIKDGHISIDALSPETLQLVKDSFKVWLEDILGLRNSKEINPALNTVMQLLIEIRKEARANKDFSTSDKIRNQLSEAGILLKDEKNGEISWEIS